VLPGNTKLRSGMPSRMWAGLPGNAFFGSSASWFFHRRRTLYSIPRFRDASAMLYPFLVAPFFQNSAAPENRFDVEFIKGAAYFGINGKVFVLSLFLQREGKCTIGI
jgi:hypothetical protein